MGKQEPQIKFPEDPIEELHKKFDKFFWVVFSVGFVFVVTLIVMVDTLVVDSFHFNSTVYKEYVDRSLYVDQSYATNKNLFDQNIKNQQIIIDQQKKIMDMFLKK